MHFFLFCSLFWDREELTTQHTPLALHTLYLHTNVAGWGPSGKHSTTVNEQEALGDVRAIIVWLFGEAGRVIVSMRWYEFRNVGRADGKTQQLQTVSAEVVCR